MLPSKRSRYARSLTETMTARRMRARNRVRKPEQPGEEGIEAAGPTSNN